MSKDVVALARKLERLRELDRAEYERLVRRLDEYLSENIALPRIVRESHRPA